MGYFAVQPLSLCGSWLCIFCRARSTASFSQYLVHTQLQDTYTRTRARSRPIGDERLSSLQKSLSQQQKQETNIPAPQRNSNPRFHQSSALRPTPQTARPPGPARESLSHRKNMSLGQLLKCFLCLYQHENCVTNSVLGMFAKVRKSDYQLRHICLSVRLRGTIRLPLHGFS